MLVYILSILLFGVAAAFLVNFIYQWKDIRAARDSMLKKEKKNHDSMFIKLLYPLIEFMSPCFKGFKWGGYRKYISKKLLKAGLDDDLRVEEILAYQILLSAIFSVFIILAVQGVSVWIIFTAILGFLFPIAWLHSKSKERYADITYNLPQVLDLLSLSVEAGLDFISAVSRIVDKSSKSALIDELRRMQNRIKLGRNRADSLIELKKRLSHPSVDSFVAMLLQAEKLGASIGPILKAHAEKLRGDRFQRAEKAGVIAAQKLLFPLIFCIMPAVFIVVFGPIFVMWKTGVFERMFA